MLSAKEKLSRRWRPALMAFFMRRVRDHAEAEDLTQEVFVRMLRSAEGEGAPDVYVFQIASNLLADRARRFQVRKRHLDALEATEDLALDPIDPHRIMVGRAELTAFAAALEELPDRTRAMFILYRMENMGQDKIAETFGISTSAVKKQIAKAMVHLMSRLEERK
jgi:RNA polymerase sigma-70 factor (ECF subfamily)